MYVIPVLQPNIFQDPKLSKLQNNVTRNTQEPGQYYVQVSL
jgi:hypothetical protein